MWGQLMIYNGKIKRKNDQRPQRSVVDVLGLLVYWLIVAPITFIAGGTWSSLKWLVRNSWAATKWTARNGWAAIVWIAKVSWYGTVWAIGGSWKTFVVAPLRWLRILINQLIAAMEMEDRELLSLYYGEDISEEEAGELAEQIEAQYEDIEIELLPGGQPYYFYILGAE